MHTKLKTTLLVLAAITARAANYELKTTGVVGITGSNRSRY
jgi:hypothetical protein